jgi:hypothetical protein
MPHEVRPDMLGGVREAGDCAERHGDFAQRSAGQSKTGKGSQPMAAPAKAPVASTVTAPPQRMHLLVRVIASFSSPRLVNLCILFHWR